MKINLKAFRNRKRLSLRELSEMTGISKSVINSIERGLTSPTIYQLHLLSEALNVSMWNLIIKGSIENVGGDSMEENLKEAIELLKKVKDKDYVDFILCLLKDYLKNT